ncbi:hypothetical protein ACNJYA_21170 [Bradyrhizobium sp. DASA03068]|uniref:hypothetical protein n=1 Tax=Bradyrhizobium sp. BLXBL-01 TaxID=3395915 RepID=UPI003F71927A
MKQLTSEAVSTRAIGWTLFTLMHIVMPPRDPDEDDEDEDDEDEDDDDGPAVVREPEED